MNIFKTNIRNGKLFLWGLISVAVAAAIYTSVPAAKTVFSVAEASGKRKLPIYSVETNEKKAALTFDAAWGADDTEKLLGILKENNVKATFFLCGYWVDKNPEEVKRIYEEGHDIGNHSDTHAHGAQLSLEQNKSEISKVGEKLKALLGNDVTVNLYRPPFGEYNNTVIEAAESLDYYAVQWDVEPLHTEVKHTETL